MRISIPVLVLIFTGAPPPAWSARPPLEAGTADEATPVPAVSHLEVGSIRGRATLPADGGATATCAKAMLAPDTLPLHHSVENFRAIGRPQGEPPPELKEVLRTTKCDFAGNFKFSNLPLGKSWLVVAPVLWRNQPQSPMQGAILLEALRVDQDVEIVLDQEDRWGE